MGNPHIIITSSSGRAERWEPVPDDPEDRWDRRHSTGAWQREPASPDEVLERVRAVLFAER
jgi:hypothetical protein